MVRVLGLGKVPLLVVEGSFLRKSASEMATDRLTIHVEARAAVKRLSQPGFCCR